jgi:putative transposase
MRKARFTEEQMVRILRVADQGKVADVAKKHGVSEQTIYLWRKRFGQLDTADVRRLRSLEAENARLKKLVAERDLEIEVMRELAAKMVSAQVRRSQVLFVHRRGLSLRRACALLSVSVSRWTLGHRSRMQVKDAPLLERMRPLAARYPRVGYRRIQVYMARAGHPMSPGRMYRLWRMAKLQVPRKRRQKACGAVQTASAAADSSLSGMGLRFCL